MFGKSRIVKEKWSFWNEYHVKLKGLIILAIVPGVIMSQYTDFNDPKELSKSDFESSEHIKTDLDEEDMDDPEQTDPDEDDMDNPEIPHDPVK